jgi:hypothetical protein
VSDIAKGVIIGVVVAILMLGLVIESQGILFARTEAPPPTPAVAPGDGTAPPASVRLGPDGKADSFFGEDLVNASIPGSDGYNVCFGELRVLRPSMMISRMPDSFCSVAKDAAGKWVVSTGGWQQCQVVCFNTGV